MTGEAAYPYHYHLAEEELVIVLLGRPSVRTDGEWRELTPGDVLSFPRGRAGAHHGERSRPTRIGICGNGPSLPVSTPVDSIAK